MRARSLLMLAALALSAAPAVAGHGEKGDWEFGVYTGLGWPDDYNLLKPDNDVLYGGRVGFFFTPHISFEGSYQRIATHSDLPFNGSLLDIDLDSIRLNFLWNFRPGGAFRPFLTVGGGSEKIDVEHVGDSTDFGYNAGGGFRWFFTHHCGLRLDGRWVSTDVSGDTDKRQRNVEGTLGVMWAFGGGPAPDSDGDGVPDRKDKCPDTPRGCMVDEKGCPKDADGDGVCDGLDACPDTPNGCTVDPRGCPLDSDGDGVIDCQDRCPNTPKGATVNATGCPTDTDGDGVYDGLDACADTPKGCPVDRRGCPLDGDGDGVIDCRDKCANTPRGAKVDADGCEPPAPKREIPKDLILEGVTFPSDKWELTEIDKTILDTVAASLKEWPGVRIEVQGHTDSINTDAHNMQLSQKRAESVMNYLVSSGISPSQLTAKGYGESQPIADDKTKEGRAKNRRVDLHRLN